MKLLFPKQNYNILSPSSYTHISVRDLYTYFLDQSAYSAAWKYVDRSWENINRSQKHMNMEIGSEAEQFSENEYIYGIFLAVCVRGC